MNGLHLRQVLDKMLKGEATKNARVQVCLPNGKYYDITSLQLLENKILGARETHRLVLTVQAETWNMGQVLKKIDQPVCLKNKLKPETKFWHEVKRKINKISWIRIENLSVPGTPDLLGYNNLGHFFTVELKYTKTNKIKFSPHQIAFHVKHPNNTFILVLDACLKVPKLYEGSRIRELVACGLTLEPCSTGYDACCLTLETL